LVRALALDTFKAVSNDAIYSWDEAGVSLL